ncbi:substrate of the Dot/Icm system [Legionella rubrilucens]|uniref:Substrate of the Dot/Icm system n=1 Tax=Legionella rubrilucens TaxID=458 RepID=A0A0W0XVL1_9GAMM|nr:alpha/beta fold hydrolase [Legionella rubrilucens]KTD48661.1 substrate of the Dot/Icm system [Legionella rubrilucens]
MANVYNAPKPRYSGWTWAKFIAARFLFPPVLLWDALKYGMNKALGERVSEIVLPAQTEDFKHLAVTDENVSKHNYSNNDIKLTCEKHTVITHDYAQLDTFEIKHSAQKDTAPQYQKYIVNLVGNGMCYEEIIGEMQEDAQALQANVVGFNLRGVGQSQGKPKSKDDLITDGIAQVQRLLDLGVSPQNITLKGHSLGAGIASLVAQHFHQLGQPINVFNSRSFSSITNFVVGKLRLKRDASGREENGHTETTGMKVAGWLAKPFIKFGVALVKWEMDAGSAFKSIPEAYKDYIVVRTRKGQRDKSIDDKVIPHYASIHKELSAERRKKKAEIDKEIENLDNLIETSDPLAKGKLMRAREALVEARERIKSDRKMETAPHRNGHNVEWDALTNRSGKTAETFFREFVERTTKDHAVKSISLQH